MNLYIANTSQPRSPDMFSVLEINIDLCVAGQVKSSLIPVMGLFNSGGV